jgi:hypothetical protein
VLAKEKRPAHDWELHQKSSQRQIKYSFTYPDRMNLGNTPNKGPKSSLSPMRSRRTESSMVGRVNLSRRRNEPMCSNEPNKPAKFVTYSDE